MFIAGGRKMFTKISYLRKAIVLSLLVSLMAGLIPQEIRAEELLADDSYLADESYLTGDTDINTEADISEEADMSAESNVSAEGNDPWAYDGPFQDPGQNTDEGNTNTYANPYKLEIDEEVDDFVCPPGIYKRYYILRFKEAGIYEFSFGEGSSPDVVYKLFTLSSEPTGESYTFRAEWDSSNEYHKSYFELNKSYTYHLIVASGTEGNVPFKFKITKRRAVNHKPTDFYETSFDDAFEYEVGTEAKGNLYPPQVYKHHYNFTVERTGRYAIEFDRGEYFAQETTYKVSDRQKAEPNDNYYNDYMRWYSGDVGQGKKIPEWLDLEKGVVYHLIVENGDDDKTVDYSFKITPTAPMDHKKADVNTDASLVELGVQYEDAFVKNFRKDEFLDDDGVTRYFRVYPDPFRYNFEYQYELNYYKLTVPSNGKLTLDFDPDKSIGVMLASTPDALTEYGAGWRWEAGMQAGHNSKTIDLLAGTYYLGVGQAADDDIVNYSFKAALDPIVINEDEVSVFDKKLNGSNTDWEKSDMINTGKTYVAQSAYGDESNSDWFSFELKRQTPLNFSISSSRIETLSVGLYEATAAGERKNDKPVWTVEAHNDKPVVGAQITVPTGLYDDKTTYVLPAGIYYLEIVKSGTGDYRFGLLNGIPQAVESVDIKDKDTGKSVSSIAVILNKTRELTAEVLPTDAPDHSVVWKSSNENIATVDNAGVVTGVTTGTCEITATSVGLNTNGRNVSDSVLVLVKEESSNPDDPDDPDDPDNPDDPDDWIIIGPDIVVKQKINLYDKEYLDEAYDKNDKFKVTPKKMGKVKNGVFTAKKAGTVKITRLVKVGKDYMDLEEITFKIINPAYPKNRKGKAVKKFTLYRPGDSLSPEDVLSLGDSKIVPTKYSCADKKKKFIFDPDTGIVETNKNGKCTVTVYYGDVSRKYAAKYVYTVTAKMPELPNSVTVKKGKTKKISIKNVRSGHNPTEWIAFKYDPETGITDLQQDLVEITPVTTRKAKTNMMKCKVKGKNRGPVYIAAAVDGVWYVTRVTVK